MSLYWQRCSGILQKSSSFSNLAPFTLDASALDIYTMRSRFARFSTHLLLLIPALAMSPNIQFERFWRTTSLAAE